jgi:hypothetical protein
VWEYSNDGVIWYPFLSSVISAAWSCCDLYDNAGGITIGISWTDITWDTERKKTTEFSHTASSAEITINTTGTYIFMARVSAADTTGSYVDLQIQVLKNSGAGYVAIPGTYGYAGFETNDSSKGTAPVFAILDLVAGDKIKVQGIMLNDCAMSTLAKGSSLVIFSAVGLKGDTGSAGPPTGAASGDLAGSYPGPTVAQASAAFALNGVISPASIGAHQNDYNPADLSAATFLRLTSNAAYNITGLAGGSSGRLISLHNYGTYALTLKDENASSAAANRFAISDGSDFVLNVDESCILQYDATSSRWRIIGAARVPYGTAVNTACQGNDSRLSDNRTDNNAIHNNVASEISALTEKTAVIAADLFVIEDSANSNNKKKSQIGNIPLANNSVGVASSTTTTSVTDVLMNSMTLTPAAGTYMVWFSGDVQHSVGAITTCDIWSGGSLITTSQRSVNSGNANNRIGFNCMAVVTVNGSQAIEGKWRTASGTATNYYRGMQILKVD